MLLHYSDANCIIELNLFKRRQSVEYHIYSTRYIPISQFLNWNCHMPDHKLIDIILSTWLTNNYQLTLLFPNGKLDSIAQCN